MVQPPQTSWTMLHAAAAGEVEARSAFAEAYLGIVRAYLAHRWRASPAITQVDDAVQEVFLDFFREGGALARYSPEKAPNFRTFLFGVVRKVAQRCEERAMVQRRRVGDGTDVETCAADEATMSQMFDRAWARRLLTRAADRQRRSAEAIGQEALRRVELLRLRFAEGLPVRAIAELFGQPAERVHREYAKAREEFKHALRTEVAAHVRGTSADVERECQNLLSLLG